MKERILHFGIDKSCLNDLDLIILMKKDVMTRKIVGVFEICKTSETKNNLFNSIFKYNPESNKWLLTKSLYETNVILDVKRYEVLSKGNFLLFIRLYYEIFLFLLKIKKIENFELIDFFHQISYYSLKSIGSLKHFWNIWKKNRSLNF